MMTANFTAGFISPDVYNSFNFTSPTEDQKYAFNLGYLIIVYLDEETDLSDEDIMATLASGLLFYANNQNASV